VSPIEHSRRLTERSAHSRIRIPQRTQMELLDPAAPMVQNRQPVKQSRPEYLHLAFVECFTQPRPIKQARHFGICEGRCVHLIETMIRSPAPKLIKMGSAAFPVLRETRSNWQLIRLTHISRRRIHSFIARSVDAPGLRPAATLDKRASPADAALPVF